MVLSDRDIKGALASERLVIDPLDDPDLQIQASSVDLRLSDRFLRYRSREAALLDTRAGDMDALLEEFEIAPGEALILQPGDFVLGATIEWIGLADSLVGHLQGRSSIARLGITTNCLAGLIDPGSYGNITLQLANLGPMPVALFPGQRVCQISFSTLTNGVDRPYGDPSRNSKYQGRIGPVGSKTAADPDNPAAEAEGGLAGTSFYSGPANQGDPGSAPSPSSPRRSVATPEPWPAGHATKGTGTI